MKARPFLKWAGGKINLIHELVKFLPPDINQRRYIEPFLGGGSMFFYLAPKKSIVSDINNKLINCYKQIRDNPDQVFYTLVNYQKRHSSKFYYALRDKYNKSSDSAEEAAQFIYLNKAAFNGIFRVNNRGEFNVPFNQKEKIGIPSMEQLAAASRLLKKTKIISADYKSVLGKTNEGDFLYLDPPYPPLNGTAYFTHYTKEKFIMQDQQELANIANIASNAGAKVLISNANTEDIKHLYNNWHKIILPVRRWITCKKEKHLVEELIIKNY